MRYRCHPELRNGMGPGASKGRRAVPRVIEEQVFGNSMSALYTDGSFRKNVCLGNNPYSGKDPSLIFLASEGRDRSFS